MQKSKLRHLLEALNRKEVKDLLVFLQSPMHNQRKDVILLLEYITSKGFNVHTNWAKESIYEAVYKDKKYDEKKTRYLISFLYQKIKQFLAWQEFSKNKLQQQLLTTRAIRKKGLDALFEKEYHASLRMVEQIEQKNADYHLLQYRFSQEAYEHGLKSTRTDIKSFKKLSNELTTYFVADKLKQACSAISHQTLSEVNLRHDLTLEAIKLVEQGTFKGIPAIEIYYHGYQAMNGIDSEMHFDKLIEKINIYGHHFPKEEMKDIYLLGINYCIKKYNSGKTEYLKRLFELYQEGLRQEVFIEGGYISPFTFKNIISAALGLKEFDWAEAFLKKYKELLDPKIRENTYNYNLAVVYFNQRNYDEAMLLLHQAEFKDLLLNLNARRMLLRMYFEQEEFDALESLLDSFKNFIYRQKDMGYHKTNYLNLIKFSKKLLKTPQHNKMQREKLRIEIQQEEAVAEKNWLLAQLN